MASAFQGLWSLWASASYKELSMGYGKAVVTVYEVLFAPCTG